MHKRKMLWPSSQNDCVITDTIVQLWALRALLMCGGIKRERVHTLTGIVRAFELDVELDEDGDPVDREEIQAQLRLRHRDLEASGHTIDAPPRLQRNMHRLAGLIGLTDIDQQVMMFTTLLHTEELLEESTDRLGNANCRGSVRHIARILDLPVEQVNESLSPNGGLARSGLLMMRRIGSCTVHSRLNMSSEKFAERLVYDDADPVSLMRDMVCASAPGHLTLADFQHVRPTLDILLPYLKSSLATQRPGVNVLIYGAPGVGKNQLVKAVARELATDLYEVTSEDSDGDPINDQGRLQAYRTAQNFFDQQSKLILFDEIEDVFDLGELQLFQTDSSRKRKAWINRILEGNKVPTFWLSNRVDRLDDAFIRRFDVVMELPVPPRDQREKIIRATCGELLDNRTTEMLAACQGLAPAVLTRAAGVICAVKDDAGRPPADMLVSLIGSTLQAQGHQSALQSARTALPGFYDPAFVNTDTDLRELAAGLARAGAGRLCFYGAPGTGKTACAQWLARQLDRPAMVVKASELLSKWVGDSEKNLARTFARARDEGAVLIIDEVDSFLSDRRGAAASWEVTQVNEMLTQMEQFDGIFIASTNLIDNFDQAALRRFDLKLRFDALRPEQALALCRQHCTELALPPPDNRQQADLARLCSLTPGDFMAVARRHRFKPLPDTDALITALGDECHLRQPAGQAMGFLR